ncbi:MAG: ABC transporter C-terminal domain-containing protein, partial [Bacteroidales bacterium]|nr:ABC transporter C-terminal domain-containing protein [Bacteroidales bacterium]
NHTIKQYSGGIEEYLERNKMSSIDDVSYRKTLNSNVSSSLRENKISENKSSYEERKNLEKLKRKKEREIATAEQKIEQLETDLKDIELLMNTGTADNSVFVRYGERKRELDEATDMWEKLYSEL